MGRVELVRSNDETRYIAAHIGLGPQVFLCKHDEKSDPDPKKTLRIFNTAKAGRGKIKLVIMPFL
jgi:hypothetical protein